jgi:hypothetical protein
MNKPASKPASKPAYADLKINTCFLRGFSGPGPATMPLMLIGDGDQLSLKKGDGFAEWMSDETRVKMDDGPVGEIPMWAMNRKTLHAMIDAWLDGVEFEG